MRIDELFRTLLSKLTTDFDGLFALLAPNAIVEFPYAASIGAPVRVEGSDAVRKHFAEVMARIGFTNFQFSNVRTYLGTGGDSAWFEVHGTADLPSGKKYVQDYVMYLRAEDSKIAHYREYWNMAPIMELSR